MANLDQDLSVYESEMQEIISAPPPWLVKWGLSIFFMILVALLGMASAIKYPDTIKTSLTVKSKNTSKPIKTKFSGKIMKILVKDNQWVTASQELAYMESIGNHEKILDVLKELRALQRKVYKKQNISISFLNSAKTFEFGEIQGAYQIFYQSLLSYEESVKGTQQQSMSYISGDISRIKKQRTNLEKQKQLQLKELSLAKHDYDIYKALHEKKVIADIELKFQERKLIEQQYPLQKTEDELLVNASSFSEKKKEIMQVQNKISIEKAMFLQALNNFISEIENWKSKYVLIANQSGYLKFSGFLEENQFLEVNQDIFMIDANSSDFFGEMAVPQYNMGKIRVGQTVLIKLKSYPFEEYGILHGNIAKIWDVPFKDSVYLMVVSFDMKKQASLKENIKVNNGMIADAEIITSNTNLLQRLNRNITKMIN